MSRHIDNKYRVLKRLGEGGFGVVYLVEHLNLPGTQYALKLLHADDDTTRRRFMREVQAVQKLVHPNVIPIYDFNVTSDGEMYYTMAFSEGGSLREVLDEEGPADWQRVLRWMLQVQSALSQAHNAGIVHRDLKPDNLMIEPLENGDEVVKVLDFGIAKVLTTNRTKLTKEGTTLGTPEYMSPEQALGRPLDGRSDIYSLGVVIYEVLSGRLPFHSETPVGYIAQHLHEEPRPLDDLQLPPALNASIRRALEKDPDDRQPSAAAWANEFRSILEGGAPAPPAPPKPTAPQPEPEAWHSEAVASTSKSGRPLAVAESAGDSGPFAVRSARAPNESVSLLCLVCEERKTPETGLSLCRLCKKIVCADCFDARPWPPTCPGCGSEFLNSRSEALCIGDANYVGPPDADGNRDVNMTLVEIPLSAPEGAETPPPARSDEHLAGADSDSWPSLPSPPDIPEPAAQTLDYWVRGTAGDYERKRLTAAIVLGTFLVCGVVLFTVVGDILHNDGAIRMVRDKADTLLEFATLMVVLVLPGFGAWQLWLTRTEEARFRAAVASAGVPLKTAVAYARWSLRKHATRLGSGSPVQTLTAYLSGEEKPISSKGAVLHVPPPGEKYSIPGICASCLSADNLIERRATGQHSHQSGNTTTTTTYTYPLRICRTCDAILDRMQVSDAVMVGPGCLGLAATVLAGYLAWSQPQYQISLLSLKLPLGLTNWIAVGIGFVGLALFWLGSLEPDPVTLRRWLGVYWVRVDTDATGATLTSENEEYARIFNDMNAGP